MKKNLCGRLLEYGRACRCELKDTGWGMKLVVLVITGFFCGALATEYFGNRIYFFSGGVILSDMLLVGIISCDAGTIQCGYNMSAFTYR